MPDFRLYFFLFFGFHVFFLVQVKR